MRISKEKPPIFDLIAEKFGVDWDSGVIVTYKDTVYCKAGQISSDLVVHEQTHIDQQKAYGDADEWFNKYLNDKSFRLEVELEAYRNQARFITLNLKNRDKRLKMFMHIWRSMATYYGDMISYEEAKKLIPL